MLPHASRQPTRPARRKPSFEDNNDLSGTDLPWFTIGIVLAAVLATSLVFSTIWLFWTTSQGRGLGSVMHDAAENIKVELGMKASVSHGDDGEDLGDLIVMVDAAEDDTGDGEITSHEEQVVAEGQSSHPKRHARSRKSDILWQRAQQRLLAEESSDNGDGDPTNTGGERVEARQQVGGLQLPPARVASTPPDVAKTVVRFAVIVALRTPKLPFDFLQGACTEVVRRDAPVVEVVLAVDAANAPDRGEIAKMKRTLDPECNVRIVSVKIGSRGTLATLYNYAALHLQSAKLVTHLMFFSNALPMNFPAYVDTVFAALERSSSAAAVGCTIVSSQSGRIDSQGLRVSLGGNTRPTVIVTKRMKGIHPATAAGKHRDDPSIDVGLLAERCITVNRTAFTAIRGFDEKLEFTADLVRRGDVVPINFHADLMRLHTAAQGCDALLKGYGEVDTATAAARDKVMALLKSGSSGDGGQSWRQLLSFGSIDPSTPEAPEARQAFINAISDAKAKASGNQHQADEKALEAAERFLEDSIKRVSWVFDFRSESLLGVDFSVRLRRHFTNRTGYLFQPGGLSIVPSATALNLEDLFASDLIAKVLRAVNGDFAASEVVPLKFRVLPDLVTAVSNRGRRVSATSKAISRLRVVWDMHCCECCGFANEVQQLALPLSEKIPVDFTMRPECFCSGESDDVADHLRVLDVSSHPFRGTRQPGDIVVLIIHRPPTSYASAEFPQSLEDVDYVVGRSMFEFSRLPVGYVIGANNPNITDEVWVPSETLRQVFVNSGVHPHKLRVVPEAVDVNFYDPEMHEPLEHPIESHPQLTEVTHCNFDDHKSPSPNAVFFSDFKWEPRKGWDVLLEAYAKAFRENNPDGAKTRPVLYILTRLYLVEGMEPTDRFNASRIVHEINHHAKESGGPGFEDLPPTCLIVADLRSEMVARLYRTADAFILPTRGEGWCLPVAQAMSMTLPTIACDFGGQSEFMRGDNSLIVDYELVRVPDEFATLYGVFNGNSTDAEAEALVTKWAQPSVDTLVRHLKWVVARPHEARSLGVLARRDMTDGFSEEAVGRLVEVELERIREGIVQAVMQNNDPPADG